MATQTCTTTAEGKFCKYHHPEINGWVLNQAGAKAKAKPKGKGKGKGNRLCSYFAAGNCKHGDQCTYSHDNPTLAPLESSNSKPTPKAKAKAAAEASEQGNE